TRMENLTRKIVLNYMPASLRRKAYVQTMAYRPQASFLPKIEYRGSGKVNPQKESKRYKKTKPVAV
ncbi:hypothetical protein BGX27_003010, partial [Mortierella sp. AM989]